jgi:multidrug efflux pump subunit AcrB
VFAGLLGSRLPSGFLPEEDQGYFFLTLPDYVDGGRRFKIK